MNILCLSGYPINVKTAEPIRPKLCGRPHHMTQEKVYKGLKFQKLASNKIRLSLNFENPQHFFLRNPRTFLVFVFVFWLRRGKCSQLKEKIGAKRPMKTF